jgi:hypothetical protein
MSLRFSQLAAIVGLLASMALTSGVEAAPKQEPGSRHMSRPLLIRLVVWVLGKPATPWP